MSTIFSAQSSTQCEGVAQFSQTQVFTEQSSRNRKRRERHQHRMVQKQNEARAKKRRMLWNRWCREQRIANERERDRELTPVHVTPTNPGMVRIGSINMEKSNPDKLELLVCLAASRQWEITVVSECTPTTRTARQNPLQQCRHWRWEGWELIHTGSVGILLSPAWSTAWHTFQATKHRSSSGRVLSIVLPRDPSSSPGPSVPSWIVTAVWAPVSTSPLELLDELWEEVRAAAMKEISFRPVCALASSMHEYTPHVIAGDWNAQLHEPSDEPSEVMGRYHPPARRQLDEYAYSKVLAMGNWVHADSFRPALGNSHRGTWFSSIHRKYYELDWMLVPRSQLARLVSMTLRHTTGDLHIQHSAKEYFYRLEQTKRQTSVCRTRRPDLSVLRGNTEQAQEARTTLAQKVRADCQDNTDFSDFRTIVARHTLDVCGECKRSCRKPWLRTTASARIGPLNTQCIQLRQQIRCLKERLSDDPDNEQLQVETEHLRSQRNDIKKQQRQIQRELEKDYWERLCMVSHQRQETDSFQFFQSLRSRQSRGTHTKQPDRTPSAQMNGEHTFRPLVKQLKIYLIP